MRHSRQLRSCEFAVDVVNLIDNPHRACADQKCGGKNRLSIVLRERPSDPAGVVPRPAASGAPPQAMAAVIGFGLVCRGPARNQ